MFLSAALFLKTFIPLGLDCLISVADMIVSEVELQEPTKLSGYVPQGCENVFTLGLLSPAAQEHGGCCVQSNFTDLTAALFLCRPFWNRPKLSSVRTTRE